MTTINISGVIEKFENRQILAAGAAGAIELGLALTRVGAWYQDHVGMFGYLGTGLVLFALAHKVLQCIDRRNKK